MLVSSLFYLFYVGRKEGGIYRITLVAYAVAYKLLWRSGFTPCLVKSLDCVISYEKCYATNVCA